MRVTHEMLRLTDGIWWGIAPKIGSPALIIDMKKHRRGDWQFSRMVGKMVGVSLEGKPARDESWFQCVDEHGEWMWSHGIVDGTGRITQIG